MIIWFIALVVVLVAFIVIRELQYKKEMKNLAYGIAYLTIITLKHNNGREHIECQADIISEYFSENNEYILKDECYDLIDKVSLCDTIKMICCLQKIMNGGSK